MMRLTMGALLFAGAALQGAEFEFNLDLLAGGSGQLNPPLEFEAPNFSCCPPQLIETKLPFYQLAGAYTPFGWRGGADLRVLSSLKLSLAELRLNHSFSGSYHHQANPRGWAFSMLPHRTKLLRFLEIQGHTVKDESHLEILSETDHLFARIPLSPSLELALGRQPLNFSTNYYFSPNDLFGAFAPSDFLRLYKPGQDAARLALSLSELSQVEVLGVAGYGSDGAFAPELDRRRSALLGRLHADTGAFAIGTLFGWDASRNLIGLSLEQDLGDGWMLGFEGNSSRWDDDPSRTWYDASLGLSAQFGPAVTARLEFASSPSFPLCPFCAKVEREQRSLNALGINWDSQGLWKLGLVNLSDLDRWEGLLTLNVQYSLADEADLILGGQIPWQLDKIHPFTATYFELAPLSASLQIRWFL